MASSLQQATQAAPSSGDDSAAEEVPQVSWKDLKYPPGQIGNRKPKPPLSEDDRKKQIEFVHKIFRSKVYEVAAETPLLHAAMLSTKMENKLWLKREDTQQIFSFKIRGAHNMISRLPKEQLAKGVICASSGNHAQGVAFSAAKVKTTAFVVMPKTTPQIKIDAVKRLGGVVQLHGNGLGEAIAKAKERSEKEKLTFICPVHSDVIAGQGTIGVEIARQMKDKIHAIFVPIGSGSLACGLISFYKLIFPEVLVFGVQPNDANAMAQALHRGEIVNVTDVGDFAEGVAIGQVFKEAFRICWELLDDVILVDKHAISCAIKDMFNDDRGIVETSGALSIAAAQAYCEYNHIKGKNVVAVTTGANINFDELGHIADYANPDQSIVVTKLPDRPGSFQELVELLSGYTIVEATYRISHDSQQSVFYKIKAIGNDLEHLLKDLHAAGFPSFPLSDDEIVIDHLSHMVGGRADIENESLYRFTFPEKKGALGHFFKGFRQNWKLTLLHYRYQGVTSSSVLVGVQLEKADEEAFHDYLKKVGYIFEKVAITPEHHALLKL